jgi:transcription elongation factor GreA
LTIRTFLRSSAGGNPETDANHAQNAAETNRYYPMLKVAHYLVLVCFNRVQISERQVFKSNAWTPLQLSDWRYNRSQGMEELKKKLQEEITALEMELRVELPREILKARAHGDLSENAEYHAAKERQGMVNARLGQLYGRLRDISMIDMSKIPHDRVGLGSTVVVLDVDKDEKVRYKLVTSEDVDVANGRISTSSPIGRGLLGKVVGDTVQIQIPDGVREMEIVELITIHQTVKE